MSNPVVWFEVVGSEGSELRSFYGDLFGWSYDVDDKMDYGMVAADAGRGIPGGVGGGEQQRVTFYVATPSIEASLKQAQELGGKVLMPRTALPGGTVLGMFSDPQGNAVGLVEEAA
ncbi:MAG: glyoxalase [Sandaracinaceae bacterium]|nr:glyoxalase [Sandaracinaceae bacterium]